jgi:ATP-dependent helicase/nuclease subunit B
MLIYLFSLKHYGDKKGTPLHPAGALYFQAKPSSISEAKEPSPDEAVQLAVDRIERSGVLLSDEEILRAMDSRLEGKFINVKTSRDGGVKSSSKYTALMSAQELGALEGDLCRVIGKIASRMLSGEADAAPMKIGGKNPCDWCDSRMICRYIEE